MAVNSDAKVQWRVLASSDEHVTRQGTDIPAWFDMELRQEDWPTEFVLSVLVDHDQGPIINGIRGGRAYRASYQDVGKLFRDLTDTTHILRWVTANAAGSLATKRVLDRMTVTDETVHQVGEIRDHLARRAYAATEVRRRRRVTRDLLNDVAQVYRAAHDEGQPPTAAVASAFQVSHSTAGRWVVEARKAGILGPASGTKPGEATPPT